jgi:hypothetical protein
MKLKGIQFFFLLFLAACNLEKEIDLQLPEYENQFIVECYLEPGQPFTLLLSRSASYFDPFPTTTNEFLENILEDDAEVTITHNDITYTLKNQLVFNPFTRKVFNYFSEEKVPVDYESDFELYIRTKDGKIITAETRILPVIPIDSVVVQFAETDTLARVLTYFTDVPQQKNYFRRMLHLSSLDSIPEQDFATDDRFVEDLVVFGTAYDYAEGDTIINTLYHIDQAYYEFLLSVAIAVNANGNPFGQPSPVISNLQGDADALGIFTGLSYDRVVTIIRR